ncbi:uncharacterized protein LOC125519954 [Triticum urartu]|uniref:uncharacterized protein LOC125519954 n=1 Tax=Triticum urartu TaxID=4572 RepID=UPI002043D576|nr:uncharacterized protein LOC125519954 [Triticum urartu]
MVDKNQWPKSDHGFFMFPPLLKSTAGRHKTERYKGCSEKKRKSGQHLCPICKDYGHHWHKCKKGNPDDIGAILAVRGPPKKRAKTTKASMSKKRTNKKASVALKLHAKRKGKEVADKLPHLPMVPHDSPAMGTRSKKMNPASPAMSTRSKRRLSL